MMKRLFLPLTAVLALGACDTQRDSGDNFGGIDVSARQWHCETETDTLTCSAAIGAVEDESGAYACMADEEGAVCPPAAALEGLLADLDEGVLDQPWACLLTGEHQRHCLKELGVPEDVPLPGDDGPAPEDPPDAPSDAPTPDPDPGPAPEVPPDCELGTWEAYFCAHATESYRNHGVDITFPCDIFDATAPFASTLPGIPADGGSADPNAPSCYDGEWEMRDEAWLDAVMAGCLNLSDPILVMCQQAANYAPNSGACRATGTW